MKIIAGSLYFVSDEFFSKVNDPYLKINYENTKRPHYFAFLDHVTGLYWLVPCSSKVEKFERLIQKKKEQHKPTDTIKIVKIFNRKTVLLFQDMFPATAQYIVGQYIKGGQAVRIANPKLIQELEKNAHKIIRLLICPLSSRQVKYLKLSIEDAGIPLWKCRCFSMHSISLYISLFVCFQE